MGSENPDQCRPENDGKSIVIVQTCSGQCLEFESQTRISASEEEAASSSSSSNYDLLYQKIERLDCNVASSNPKRRRRSKKNKGKNSCGSKCCGKYAGRQACYYAAGFAADCAAICCCPCAILHIFILAFVKAPSVYARKAFCYAKRKARSIQGKKDRNENSIDEEEEEEEKDAVDDEDEKGRSSWYYTPPWSCRESPQREAPSVDGSRVLKFDTEKLWSELYAAGHMGFGGLPFERN